MPIATVNPATGETVETFTPYDDAALEQRLGLAAETYRSWRTTSFEERAALLKRAADLLDAEREEIARTMTVEMGKPVVAARAEVAKCAKAMRWYADRAPELLADEHPSEADVADSGGAS